MSANSIPIGILFSMSGPYAIVARDGYFGAMAAIHEINRSARYDFCLAPEIRDPAGNTEAYAGYCRDIVQASGTQFIVGCTTSWSRKEVIPVLEKTGAHLWYPYPYEGFESHDQVVYLGACPNQNIVPLLDYVIPRFGTNPALIGSNYIWGWETNRIAREQIERHGGNVLFERYVPIGDGEIDHLISEIMARKPDFIHNALIGPSSAALLKAYHQLGQSDPDFAPQNRPIVSCNLAENEVAALNGAATGHLCIAPYFQSLDTPENRSFLANIPNFTTNRAMMTAFFVQAYAAVHMIAAGIAATGSADASTVLHHTAQTDWQSPLGPISINPINNHASLSAHIGRARVDGNYDIIDKCRQPIAPDPYLARKNRPHLLYTPPDPQPYLRVVK